MDWRKSRRSQNTNCVEVGFEKSSRCDTNACIEVKRDTQVHVRDSKDITGPVLIFDRESWRIFVKSMSV